MGWYSAVYIFDNAIDAADLLTVESGAIDFNPPETVEMAMVKFARSIAKELNDGDWDSQQESNHYERFAPYLWPKWYEEDLRYVVDHADDYDQASVERAAEDLSYFVNSIKGKYPELEL